MEEMDPLAAALAASEMEQDMKMGLINEDGDFDMSAFEREEKEEKKDADTDKGKGGDEKEDDDAVDDEDKSIPTDTSYVRKKKRLRRRIRKLQRGYRRHEMSRKEEDEKLQAILDTRDASGKHQQLMVEQRQEFDETIDQLSAAFTASNLTKAKELCRLKDGTSFSVDLFIHTCRRGNIDVVRSLVTKLGFEPNCYDVYDKTGMILATQANQQAMVQYLAVDLKANVNYVPANGMFSDGVAPLMIAVSVNNLDMVRFLLAQNGDPNQIDHRGRSAVHRACERGHTECLKLLIQGNADLDKQDQDGNSPCLYAAKFGHEDLLRVLFENGASPREANAKGHTPFARAAMRGSMEMINYLMNECGVSINTVDVDGEIPIANAMRVNRNEVVKYLALQSRTDINIKDKYGRSPVLLAVVLGNLELVSFFTLECRMFIDSKDWALVYKYAVKQKDSDMIRHLVFKCGYELQQADVKSLRLYEKSVADGDLEMTQVIVKSLGDKFEVDEKDEENNGDTALMVAVRNSDMTMVRYLHEEMKADFDMQNNKSSSPVLIGVKNNASLEVLDLLINTYECDLFLKDDDNNTVFDIALDLGIRGRNIAMVRLVLVELAEHAEGLARFLAGEKNRRKIQFLFGQNLIPEEVLGIALKHITDNRLELDPFVLLELKKATNTASAADDQASEKADKVVRTRAVAKRLMLEMENAEDFLIACTNIIKGALRSFRPFSDDMLIAICMFERKHLPEQFGEYGGVLEQLDAALTASINSGKGSKEYKWLNAYLLPSAVWFEYPPKWGKEEAKEEEKAEVEAGVRPGQLTRQTTQEALVTGRARASSASAAVALLDEKTPPPPSTQMAIAEHVEEHIEAEKEDTEVPCLFVTMLLKKYTARMDIEGIKLSEHVFDSFAEEEAAFDDVRTPVRKLKTLYDASRGFYEEMVSIAKYEQSHIDRQDGLNKGIKADKSELDLGYSDKNIQFYDMAVVLNQMVSFANQINEEFQDYVEGILKRGLSDDIYDFRGAPVKTLERCREKCETDYYEEHYPTSARLLDLVRCSVTFDHVTDLMTGMDFFLREVAKEWDPEDQSQGIRGVGRIKNGLAELVDLSREEPIAYKDIKINAIYYSKVGRKEMIVEIQLILRPFLMAKKHMHRLYKVIRTQDVYKIAVPMANERSRREGIYEDVGYHEV